MRDWICGVYLAMVVLLPAMSRSGKADSRVYVSLDGEKRIAVYAVDAVSGRLSPVKNVQTPESPGGLASDPENQFLFASLRRAGRLASFRIGSDGGLTLINTVQAGADPAYLATDRTGRFLLTAYYVAAKVSVHRIGPDGSLSQAPLQEIPTARNAHAILTDLSNRFAYVPHTGPNAIFQFRFDEESGRLIPHDPLIIHTGKQTGPRQLAFHPQLNVVFFDYEQECALAAFNLDRKTGQISFRERLSSLPPNATGRSSNSRIQIHPSGRFVYVANRGDDSLAGFRVDSKTGKLTGPERTPTEKTPRGFAIDPAGQFLYAAGQSSGRLAGYRIDQKTGRLKLFATYPVGKQPWWVHVVQLP
ncbi:MAG: beta-propeller fold lactonase family protein [Planctomycetaceae bacterium]